jgi:hypothetical protein
VGHRQRETERGQAVADNLQLRGTDRRLLAEVQAVDLGKVALLVAVLVLLNSVDGSRRRHFGAVMRRLAKSAGVGHTHREAEQPHEQHLGCPSAETSAIAEHDDARAR